MTPEARGYLLDTTALTALASSHRVSILITTAPRFPLPLYAPVTCVDAADRIRPRIARHVGRISAGEPIDLTYSAVLDLRAHPADGNAIKLVARHPAVITVIKDCPTPLTTWHCRRRGWT